jgi:hypothetical protein
MLRKDFEPYQVGVDPWPDMDATQQFRTQGWIEPT